VAGTIHGGVVARYQTGGHATWRKITVGRRGRELLGDGLYQTRIKVFDMSLQGKMYSAIWLQPSQEEMEWLWSMQVSRMGRLNL